MGIQWNTKRADRIAAVVSFSAWIVVWIGWMIVLGKMVNATIKMSGLESGALLVGVLWGCGLTYILGKAERAAKWVYAEFRTD